MTSNNLEKGVDCERPERIPRVELRQSILTELDTGDYIIDEEHGQCSRKQVIRVLRQYFKRDYRCSWLFDEEGKNPNQVWLLKCNEKNEGRKAQRLEGCMIQDEEIEDEQQEVEEPASEEEQVEHTPEGRMCQGVPDVIPDSCEAFDCAIVKDTYEYTSTRVEEHNKRRRPY